MLLRDLQFGDTSIADIMTLLQDPNKQLILSSDGWAKDRRGSFGAVMASQPDRWSPTGAILMEIGGIAFGDTPRSIRVESYGQLAILRLLLHFTIYYNVRPECRFLFLLARLRLSKDFQTREYAKLTQAHLQTHGASVESIRDMMQ
jgi:hypothetical protein